MYCLQKLKNVSDENLELGRELKIFRPKFKKQETESLYQKILHRLRGKNTSRIIKLEKGKEISLALL